MLTLIGDIDYFPYHFSDKNAEKIELPDCPLRCHFEEIGVIDGNICPFLFKREKKPGRGFAL